MFRYLSRHQMLAVGLVVALGVTVAACGSSGPHAADANVAFNQLPTCPMDSLAKAKKPVEIDFWARRGVEETNALQALVKEFNESQSDVRVTMKLGANIKQVYDAYGAVNALPDADTADLGDLAGQPVPALVSVPGTYMRQLSDSGAVLPAQSCINATKFDNSQLAPIIRAQYSIGGVQWAAYMEAAVMGLGYNAEMFRKAGLDPAKAPATLADIEADSKKIKAAGLADKPFALLVDPSLFETWLTGAGAILVSNGNGRDGDADASTIYSEAAVKLFTDLRRMYDEGILELFENDKDQIDNLVAMANGQAAITFNRSTVVTSVQAFIDGNKQAQEKAQQLAGGGGLGDATITTDYRSGPLPGLHGPGKVSIYGNAWFMSKNVPPEQQAAAWKFVEFMYKPSSQATLLTIGAALPVSPKTQQNPKVKEFWTSGLAGEWLKIGSDEVNALDESRPGPLIGPYADFETIMREAIRAIRDRPDLTPVEILNEAEQKLTQSLRDYMSSHH